MNGPLTDDQSPIYSRPAEILKYLIRYNTTNPPGNEAPCINYIKGLMDWAGIQNTVLASDPARPNLIARLPGKGSAPPLLLYGHVDVVTTLNQKWRLNPFIGEELDGCIWGRGALDMKGAVAMMMAAVMRSQFERNPPPGDVILAAVSDEENASVQGAQFLVSKHPHLFQGVKYAIGELGGYTNYIARRRFYPIMVAEKQGCGVMATVQGQGGHGAWPARGGIMSRVARLLQSLEHRLPVHITPVAKEQIRATAEGLPTPIKQTFQQMLVPALTNSVLDTLGTQVRMFDPILHNTASATAIHGGENPNMIPSQVKIALDCRLLPGFGPDDLLVELKTLAGSDVEWEITVYDPGPPKPNMGLYDTLATIIKEADPGGTPTPMLLPAVTDARHFGKLGIQTYGFTPLNLPPEINFEQLFHAADERVPVKALEFGTNCLYNLIQRFDE
jgi:acetylornithine deacetylase/succinyl-diaminopimelate desuccinylase-like protein